MTGSPEEFEARIRRVLEQAAGQLPVRPAAREGPPRPSARPSRRPSIGGIATAVAVLVAIGVVVLALSALRHSPSSPAGPPRPPHGKFVPAHISAADRTEIGRIRKELVAVWAHDPGCRPRQETGPAFRNGAPNPALPASLQVLRRSAQPSDRLPRAGVGFLMPGAYTRYVRRAETVAGTSYYVVPTSGPHLAAIPHRCAAQVRAAFRRATSNPPVGVDDQLVRTETHLLDAAIHPPRIYGSICVVALGSRAGSGDCVAVPVAQRFEGFFAGSDGDTADGLVPDGVARVAARYARGTVTAVVVGNVYVLRAPQHSIVPPQIVWLSATGKVMPQPPRRTTAGVYGFSTSASGASSSGTTQAPPKGP
jgi:hypothetical protein